MICSRPCNSPVADPVGRNPVNQVTATCVLYAVFPGRESSLPLKIKFSAHVINMVQLLRIFLSENDVGASRWKDYIASDRFGTYFSLLVSISLVYDVSTKMHKHLGQTSSLWA